jgi:hypothetical protein
MLKKSIFYLTLSISLMSGISQEAKAIPINLGVNGSLSIGNNTPYPLTISAGGSTTNNSNPQSYPVTPEQYQQPQQPYYPQQSYPQPQNYPQQPYYPQQSYPQPQNYPQQPYYPQQSYPQQQLPQYYPSYPYGGPFIYNPTIIIPPSGPVFNNFK